jgi:acyl-CoA synthetase (NDP forming)
MVDLISALQPLFEPRHVAVIGASRTPGKRGHTVTRNLIRCGFPGRISPVNPAGEAVEGLPCYPSIAALPERADCAFVALPAPQSVEAVRQCAAAGVRAVVVGSNGFAETGTSEGAEREAELTAIARAHGLRMVGPNTNGIFNANARFSLGYNHSHSEPMLPGVISVASHSGAMFDGIAGRLRQAGVGLAKFVPVGNEADLDLLDFFEYFIADPDTRVIGLVIEGLSSGARFRDLAARAAGAGKPVVALKIGRSAVGAEASLAHSSRLAGSARAYDALFTACGIAGVRTVEGLVGSCALLAGRKMRADPEDRRIICITSSGAGGALVADFADEHALPLAGDRNGDWEEPAVSAIAALPTIANVRNPLDTGSLGDWRLMSNIFAILNTTGHNGPVVVYAHNMPERRLEETLAAVLAERRKQVTAPVIILSPGGLSETMEKVHRDNGVAIFHDIASCFESLKAYDFAVNRALLSRSAPAQAPQPSAELHRLLQAAAARNVSFISEIDSAEVLRLAGVPMVESRIVRSGEEAATAADRLGSPVVLKALAPGVAHKHDRGFVITGVGGAEAAGQAYATLEGRLSSAGFARADATIIMQPMLTSKAELIIGVSHEPNLGHFLVVGLGGVLAELLDRVTLIPLPTDGAAMRVLLQGSLVATLLGRLDAGGTVMDQLIATLESLQRLVAAQDDLIESIDVNPLLVTGSGCMAVDALVVLKPAASLTMRAAG